MSTRFVSVLANRDTELARAATALSDLETQVADLRAQLRSLEDEVATFTQASSRLTQTRAELTAERDALRIRTGELEAALAEGNARLAEAIAQSAALQRANGELTQSRDLLATALREKQDVLKASLADLTAEKDGLVARAFARFPEKVIRVEGHTAVAPSRWSNSWDLGAARAVNVVRYFQEKAGVDPTRLVAVSFGQYRPLYQVAEIVNSGRP